MFGVGIMKGIKSAKSIGEQIKKRRKELGISQEKLAEALNVSYQQVQRYENGMNMLNTDKLQMVANSLDVPVAYLFEERKMMVAESLTPYLSSEENGLLRLFKRLGERDKESVFRFMQLAAKGI